MELVNLFRSGSSGNPDRFRVREFANARGAEFSAKAGTLYAAERQTRIGRDHRVNENHSGLQVRGEELLFLGIIRPRAGTEAE